ncbi:plasmid replication initiator TrfA [Methylobacillus sp. Pita2]|uniref:plasmid replication initiator TrfA n=1 Tax=Methylobacillus sp. Pita2 TaxID=3383245 RepID=UPI0038B4ADF2
MAIDVAEQANRQASLPLPIWSDHKRGVPNVIARSALFRVGSTKTKREYLESQEIASYGKTGKITYTGFELRQDDADVFLQLIHLQRMSSFEDGVEFLTTPMLKVLGRSQNSIYTEKLKKCLVRLQATALVVESTEAEGRSIGYSGSLVSRFSWRDESGEPRRSWRVWFDPKIVSLFDWAAYSQFDWQTRIKLGPLAKWLHLNYSTHKKPLPLKCETLMYACGSSMKQLKHFRQELNQAGRELVELGFLESFCIDPKRDVFVVARAISK